jgi:hypothetical protein
MVISLFSDVLQRDELKIDPLPPDNKKQEPYVILFSFFIERTGNRKDAEMQRRKGNIQTIGVVSCDLVDRIF